MRLVDLGVGGNLDFFVPFGQDGLLRYGGGDGFLLGLWLVGWGARGLEGRRGEGRVERKGQEERELTWTVVSFCPAFSLGWG